VGEQFVGSVDSVAGRPFRGLLPPSVLDAIQGGVLRMSYRGVPCLKSPFDLSLYMLLIQRVRPQTVIEIGTMYGGSALWFADMLTVHGIERAHVVSIDIEPLAALSDPRITFARGNAQALHEVLDPLAINALLRPFLIVEDSSHLYADSLAVLNFFHKHLTTGDYIVVEDGNLSQFSGSAYEHFDDGPNRAVTAFLSQHPNEYAIDESLCDYFGYNVTYNPNGWLRRL
jgi:cephalosporin hydroxylase